MSFGPAVFQSVARAAVGGACKLAWRANCVCARVALNLVPVRGREREAIARLRSEAERIAGGQNEDRGIGTAEPAWRNNRRRLREYLLRRDPRAFLTWDVVTETMFPAPYSVFARRELKFLREHEWGRWKRAIRERAAGTPSRCWFYPASSTNAIHHAYHLCRFEGATSARIGEFDEILEFGGGYGSLCRIAHNAGFAGHYTIFDLAEQCALQRYYLDAVGIDGVELVSDLDVLRRRIGTRNRERSLFLATWSLSESPEWLRKEIAALATGFKGFLIAYQDAFSGTNNVSFFRGWQAGAPEMRWAEIEIGHLPGNRYLFGIAGQ